MRTFFKIALLPGGLNRWLEKLVLELAEMPPTRIPASSTGCDHFRSSRGRDVDDAISRHGLRTLALCSIVLFVCTIPCPLFAQEQTGQTSSPVIESMSTVPWYDAEQHKLIPIDVSPRKDDSTNRESRWLPKPKSIAKSATNSATTTNTPPSNSGLFGSGYSVANLFGWVILATVVIVIVGVIVYAVGRAEMKLSGDVSHDSSGANGRLPDQQTLERIKHLPPELRRTDVNLRTECERLMLDGKYDQAIILLLGHQLLLLDKQGLLRLARGKTNGTYVRETRSNDADCAMWLRQTADAFEHSYFGRHSLSREVFVQLWQQNQSMEQSAIEHGGHP